MSFSVGEPGIAQQVNPNDDQRPRRAPIMISSLQMALGCSRPAGTFIGFGGAGQGLQLALVGVPGYTLAPDLLAHPDLHEGIPTLTGVTANPDARLQVPLAGHASEPRGKYGCQSSQVWATLSSLFFRRFARAAPCCPAARNSMKTW
jgi:hypothetical protein